MRWVARLSACWVLVSLAACRPGAIGVDASPETSGDGDGEGDPLGDGDGDPTSGDGDGDSTTGDGDGESEPDEPEGDFVPDAESDAGCQVQPNAEPLCEGPECPITRDLELRCEDQPGLVGLGLGLSPTELIASFRFGSPDYDRRTFIAGDELTFVAPLPEGRFTSQGPDGTLYRSIENEAGEVPAYLRRAVGGWSLVEVPDLPIEVNGDDHLRFIPIKRASGGLEGYVDYGDWHLIDYFWARRGAGGEWQLDSIGDAAPSHGPQRIDLDASDRPYGLFSIENWHEDFPELGHSPLYATFLGEAKTLVGAPEHRMPDAIANPPRPELGGPAIALLREHEGRLHLLTIDELDSWTEVELALPSMLEICPFSKPALDGPEDPCPPCLIEGLGLVGYGLARTSGGGMWLAWVESEGYHEAIYEQDDTNCESISFPSARTGTLHVRELDNEGNWLRSLAIPLGELESNRLPAGRIDAIVGFGESLALAVAPETHSYFAPNPGEGRLRLLTIDTGLLD